MRIRLLAFATAAQALGAAESEVEVPDGATVGTLARLLGDRHPELAAPAASAPSRCTTRSASPSCSAASSRSMRARVASASGS